MERKQFSIKINALKDKIWRTLWEDRTYRDWTTAFSEGSYAVSDWKEGGKIHFLIPSGSGMYSRIERHVPQELMVFEHLGVIENGKEKPVDEKTRQWSGAKEIYKLNWDGTTNELIVEMDMIEDDAAMFEAKFPAALQRVKELAEG